MLAFLALAKRVPLWLYGAVAFAGIAATALHIYAVKQRAIGVALERTRSDSVQMYVDSVKTATITVQRDSAVVALVSANERLGRALQTAAPLRARINVTAATHDTVTVPVPAAYVKACDLITATCEEVRHAALTERALSDSVIGALRASAVTLNRRIADGLRPAPTSTRARVISGAIGVLLGYGARQFLVKR